MNVKDLDSPSPLHVFSGQADYATPPRQVWEQPAEFYCPVIASLVTGGSHLLCATLERAVRDRGGEIAAMDTDSAMVVSTRDGGVLPCAGLHRLEDYRVPSGHASIRALSYAQVDRIRERFEALNPWRDTLKVPFLKLEEENFRADGERHQLYAVTANPAVPELRLVVFAWSLAVGVVSSSTFTIGLEYLPVPPFLLSR